MKFRSSHHCVLSSDYFWLPEFLFSFKALKEGQLYAIRNPLFDNLESVPDITDHDPRRKRWDWQNPIALFYTDRGAPAGIRPLAIQMHYTPGETDGCILSEKPSH